MALKKKRKKFNPLAASKARRTRGRPKGSGILWNDGLRAEIVRQLIEGATTREVCEQEGFPSRSELFRELRQNENFANAYSEAKVEAPGAILDIAMDYATDASGDTDGERMRMAESYSRVAHAHAAAIAPKKYGQLLKVGNADGDGPLVVEIVSFAATKKDAPQASE
jgi:hypothetical protein